MGNYLFAHAHTRQLLTWAAAAALVVSVAGCSGEATTGDGEPTGTPQATTAATGEQGAGSGAGDGAAGDGNAGGSGTDAEPASSGFCADVEGIGDELLVANFTNDGSSDPQGYVDTVAAGAQRFGDVQPPADIADSWAVVANFFSTTHSHLDGVDVTQPNAITDALTFDSEEPDAFAMVILTPGHSEMVAVFVQQECGVDLGVPAPPLANVCDAIDTAHLESAFDGAVPAGENRPWSNGVVECMWQDDDGTQVGLVVGPLDAVLPQLIQHQEPFDSVATDGASIDIYDGALGPLRSADGRTASIEVGDVAVLASVGGSDYDAGQLKAVALAGITADIVR